MAKVQAEVVQLGYLHDRLCHPGEVVLIEADEVPLTPWVRSLEPIAPAEETVEDPLEAQDAPVRPRRK
jgi:hypothetical protein